MSYRDHQISKRTEQIDDAVRDGHPEAVAQFAQSLSEGGALGVGMELTAATTVTQMVDHYLSDSAGKRDLREWAAAVADDEQTEAEIERGAA